VKVGCDKRTTAVSDVFDCRAMSAADVEIAQGDRRVADQDAGAERRRGITLNTETRERSVADVECDDGRVCLGRSAWESQRCSARDTARDAHAIFHPNLLAVFARFDEHFGTRCRRRDRCSNRLSGAHANNR